MNGHHSHYGCGSAGSGSVEGVEDASGVEIEPATGSMIIVRVEVAVPKELVAT